jgi:ABC-type phosphate/phosphonate transport system substrate-binding protein
MKKKALLLVSAIIVLLLFTGCNRARNDSSQNSQPLTAATVTQSEAATAQAAVDNTQPEVTTPTLSVLATVPANRAQATEDFGNALDKAIDDLNSTDELTDLP